MAEKQSQDGTPSFAKETFEKTGWSLSVLIMGTIVPIFDTAGKLYLLLKVKTREPCKIL